MSGTTFDTYHEGADLAVALQEAIVDARRRRNGHGPGNSGMAQKKRAVQVHDVPVPHMRAISIARHLMANDVNKIGDQFADWCGAIPVCAENDDAGEHIIGWLFVGVYHT